MQALGGPLICNPSGTGVGGACFDVHAGDASVAFETEDVRFDPPHLEVWFMDASGGIIDTWGSILCDGRGTLDVPDGAVRAIAHVLDNGGLFCEPRSAMAGNVTATFA